MENKDVSPEGQAPRKAYSYLRFSTPEQRKGDSFRRQRSMAEAYAAKSGLELDQELTFDDVGISGFRGQNAEAGKLALFLEAVRSGQVPQGSVLLVEQLDRLSRLPPRKALRVLEDIVDAGVDLVTLNDERVYTQGSLDNEPMDLMVSILTFMRANEESVTKSKRLKATWEQKRQKVLEGKPITERVPAWLKLSNDRQRFIVIKERGDIVRRVYDLTLDGWGQHRIASQLNEQGIKPWGRGQFWHRSYISKILQNPAVIGTFCPHLSEFDGTRKRRVPLEPVERYYPAVVSVETFQEAQALREVRKAPQRGRHAHTPITNILAGLAECPKCGATMTRVNKGSRSKPSLVCSRAKIGAGCTYRSVPYGEIEKAVLDALPKRLQLLEGATGKDTQLDDEIRGADEVVDQLRERASNLLNNLSLGHSPMIAQKARETEQQLEEALAALEALQKRREAATGRTVKVRIEKALEALQPVSGDVNVEEVNQRLRALFSRAVIQYDAVHVEFEWTHGGSLDFPYSHTFTKWQGE
ncbi:Site-specific DNA recombinase [Altererythrobacter xiamenensis]|uniref:Site-specific DNA recombinase n=1 Tax=Altererythrobacter xiamenensis TaxID=1316679 RepID=A0A1Y6F3R9_9SPHN|nr:recombinase family protein [Altererythrobacter xiamenensis]SMQ69505.1 Site-specific DNA recombinase [Altererythrobacter xiamenensis]